MLTSLSTFAQTAPFPDVEPEGRRLQDRFDTPVIQPALTPAADNAGVVINGVRWATRNVAARGTFASAPEDSGGWMYAWDRHRTTEWFPVPGAERYNVYNFGNYPNMINTFRVIATVTTTTFVHTGLQPNSSNHYRITAVNNAG